MAHFSWIFYLKLKLPEWPGICALFSYKVHAFYEVFIYECACSLLLGVSDAYIFKNYKNKE